MLAYLTSTEAQWKLINSNDFDAASVPNTERLEVELTITEAIMDEWLGQRLAIEQYTEILVSNYEGVVTVSNWPLKKILLIEFLYPNTYNMAKEIPIPGIWNHGNSISIGYYRDRYRVTYLAGREVQPSTAILLKEITFNILRKVLSNGVESLYERTRTLTNVGLPGISQNYAIGEEDKRVGGTVLDKTMMPLIKYKRKLFT